MNFLTYRLQNTPRLSVAGERHAKENLEIEYYGKRPRKLRAHAALQNKESLFMLQRSASLSSPQHSAQKVS